LPAKGTVVEALTAIAGLKEAEKTTLPPILAEPKLEFWAVIENGEEDANAWLTPGIYELTVAGVVVAIAPT
jgi:hypothetical protein